jgi:phytanoyl-CoA hydroxylase
MINTYKKEGYLVLKNFFSKEEIQILLDEVKGVFAQQIKRVLGIEVDIHDTAAFDEAMYAFFEQDFEAFVGTGKNVQHLISLHKLGVDERLMRLVKQLGLSTPVIAVRPAIQFNSRHLSKNGSTHWRLGAHQDWRTGQGSLDSVVCWFPMVDAGEALGALQVIPQSHTWGLMEANTTGYAGFITENLSDEDFVQCEFEVGDLLIFSAFLVHRSGNNVTEDIRWSVQLRYNNLDETSFIERGYPQAYIYKPQEELVTPDFPSKEALSTFFA